MKKSSIIKLSNSHLFQQIKSNLLPSRKISQIEVRLILKQNHDRLFHDPETEDFENFLTLAREAYDRKDFNEAFLQINKAIELFEKLSDYVNDQNNFDKARICELAGRIYKRNHKIQGSIYFLERSFKILSNTLGENNIYILPLFFELIDSYLNNWMGNEAIVYLKKYLNLQNLRNEKFDTNILYIIGVSYYYKEGPKIALKVFKQVLELSEKLLEKNTNTKFYILWSIGNICLDAREFDKARSYYKQCLNIFKNSPSVKEIIKEKICDFLMEYYFIHEKYDQSLYFVKTAIKYLKRSLKDNLLKIVTRYKQIANIHWEKNDMEKWLHYVRKHMTILKKIVGPRHPEFLTTMIEYSSVLEIKGYYKKSLKILKNTKKELKEVFESNMYLKAFYKFRKGSAYLMLERTKKSLKKLEEAKKLFFEYFGENHPVYIDCYSKIGSIYCVLDHFDKALSIKKQVLAMYQRVYSYYHELSAGVLYQIAAIHLLKGKVISSLKYYRRSLNILKGIDLQSTYLAKIIYLGIAELYLRTGKEQRFFYYFNKSSHLNAKNNIKQHIYWRSYFSILSSYFCHSENYEAAKRVEMKYLSIHLSSGQYNLSQAVKSTTEIALLELEISNKNFSKANKLFSLTKKLYNELIKKDLVPENNPLLSGIYSIKAGLYKALGKYEQCLNTFRTILSLQRHFYKKYDRPMLALYTKISLVLFENDKFSESLQMSKRVLKMERKAYNNPVLIFKMYNNVGLSYANLKQFNLALKYWKKSLHTLKNTSRYLSDELKENYLYIGVSCFQLNQHDRALKYFNKANHNIELTNDMSFIHACIWNSIGISLVFKYLHQEALGIFKFCVESAKASKFDKQKIQKFIHNFKETERAIEKQKTLREELRRSDSGDNSKPGPEVCQFEFKHIW